MLDQSPEKSAPSPQTATPPAASWDRIQRRLHWGVAAVVGIQFLSQGGMREAMVLVDANTAPGLGAFLIVTLHVWGGAAAGAAVLWRVRLRAARPLQNRPLAAHINHAVLYLLLIVMAVSGALHYGAGIEAAARWHVLGKWLLLASLALHIAGALWHLVVKRDRVLASMLGMEADR